MGTSQSNPAASIIDILLHTQRPPTGPTRAQIQSNLTGHRQFGMDALADEAPVSEGLTDAANDVRMSVSACMFRKR